VPFEQDIVQFKDWPQFQINQAHLSIVPPLGAGESRRFVVRYSGTLVGYTETGMRYVQDRVDREFTILRADALAFPQIGVPSFEANVATGDFTFEAVISVPSELTVACGVPETRRETADDVTTWSFEGERPVPFLLITVAPYEVIQHENLRVFHFPSDADGARGVLEAMQRTLGLYERWFGPLGSDAVLHVIEIPEGWGSQASLTAGIIQTAEAFRDAKQRTQLDHELAHLWHPDDRDRRPPRWNEGLAMFLQQRVAKELDGVGSLDEFMEKRARSLVEQMEQTPQLSSVPMSRYGEEAVTGLSYGTGRLMFYVLYRVLGANEFDRRLGSFFRKYRATGGTTEQFVASLSDGSAIDLGPLFRDWLFTTGWAERLSSGQSLQDIVESY
jgi:aminopeptidase N